MQQENVPSKVQEFEEPGRKLEREFAHLKFTFIGPCSPRFFQGYHDNHCRALGEFVPALIKNCSNAIMINPEQMVRYMKKWKDNCHFELNNDNLRDVGLIARHCPRHL